MIQTIKTIFTLFVLLSFNANATSATATASTQVLKSIDYISTSKVNKVIFDKSLDKVIITNKEVGKRIVGDKEELILNRSSHTEIIF